MISQSGSERHGHVNIVLSILKFTVAILLPRYPRSFFTLFAAVYIAKRHRREKRQILKFKVVPEDGFEYLIPKSVMVSEVGNTDSLMLVSFNTLKNLGILANSSWVNLQKPEEHRLISNSDGTESYLVKIVAIPNVEDFLAIVTNVLYYNVSCALSLTGDTASAQKVDGFESFTPYIATSARVSLLQSPHDSINVDAVLSTYFQQPRFLRVNDLYSINIANHTPTVFYSTSKTATLYFRVLEVEGPSYEKVHQQGPKLGYYIVKEYTSLTQSSDHQGYIPRNDSIFINRKVNSSEETFKLQVLSSCPDGLDGYRDELLVCVETFVPKVHKCQLKPMFLLCGPRGVGKGNVVKNVAERLGLHIFVTNSYEVQGDSPGYSEGRIKYIFTRARHCAPCILFLRNIDILCKDVNGDDDNRIISFFTSEVQLLYQEARKFPVILIATCDTKNESTYVIAPALARLFLHVIHIRSPNDTQRSAMLQWLLMKNGVATSADLSHVAAQTSGFLYTDLAALVSHAIRNRYKAVKEKFAEEFRCRDVSLQKVDFEIALDVIHTAYADAIDAPKVPKVLWSDVGGLSDLKEEIIRTVSLPLEHPELLAAGLRRSGILLYGPPGTGKTLLAKAVATECNLSFLSVKGPELLNMYVGQSEENVREVFSRARASSPCVIFFDELDSLAPNRGRSGDSGGVMDRVVSQLLAELDGLQKSTQLFVIGATNRPDLIDPALLRPGRFDKLLYVGVSTDTESKLSILMALTKRFQLSSDVQLESVVPLLPDSLTGADLYSLCSRAWLNAVRTKISNLKCGGSSVSMTVEVGMQDFITAINNLVPSVSKEDLAYFQHIKEKLIQ